YVVEDPNPFIVPGGADAASLINTRNGERQGQAPRVLDIRDPYATITAQGSRGALVAAFLAKHYGGNYTGPGHDLRGQTGTVTTVDHHALVTAHMLNMKGSDRRDSAITEPAR